ncbi:MAG: twin-arginine translocase subunit TatB [Proteobacteria bacterium]|jgi:sec-independent protein translocase protein TatB|nr:twin-arginine translocase subunit TatB [Pseudomonadota bacterium]
MFDIGFSEIVLIAVVALVVLGPERLPKAARTLGHLFGRLQRYVNEVKADISREMELEELRKLKTEMQGAAQEFERTMTSAANDVASGVRDVERELNEAAAGTAAPAALPAGTASAPGAPGASAGAGAAEGARQATLPGFDRI